jgi:hypothetical protein
MKIVLAIVVYNRFENLSHWLACLEKCNTGNVEVVVIHNTDSVSKEFEYLTWRYDVGYIPRPNIGYDIGAFQDVCLNRLQGFPEWDKLLWVTDDVFPMSTNFIKRFNNSILIGVGVAAMEVSLFIKEHIRTSGFMITKECANKLNFPADPIITKKQCYEFEHMSDNTFLEQVREMGLGTVQFSNRNSPLWDSGYLRKLPRQQEHENTFGPMPEQPKPIPKRIQLLNDK